VAVLLAALGAFWSFAGPGAPTAQARTADELLVDRPLAPTDVNILKTDVYPSGAPLVPAAGNEPSEQQAKAGLDAYLTAEFPGSAASQNAAKAVFDDATAKAKIPSHSLRAALAALTGTVAELPRRHNINAMERLNGGMGSRLGLYATNGNRPIFPGSPTVAAIAEHPDDLGLCFSWALVQHSGQLAAVLARQRAVRAQLRECPHHHLAQLLAAVSVGGRDLPLQ